MKKVFLLIASAAISTSAFADAAEVVLDEGKYRGVELTTSSEYFKRGKVVDIKTIYSTYGRKKSFMFGDDSEVVVKGSFSGGMGLYDGEVLDASKPVAEKEKHKALFSSYKLSGGVYAMTNTKGRITPFAGTSIEFTHMLGSRTQSNLSATMGANLKLSDNVDVGLAYNHPIANQYKYSSHYPFDTMKQNEGSGFEAWVKKDLVGSRELLISAGYESFEKTEAVIGEDGNKYIEPDVKFANIGVTYSY